MDAETPFASHLFTLRVWPELDEDGRVRWRGKLHHISSDEVRHFRGWSALIPLLLDILRRHPYHGGRSGPDLPDLDERGEAF